MKCTKKAFTMIELIFVIVILGIVASIGSEIIAKVYEQYILQRAEYRASSKSELAALQIANRLQYMVPNTLYRIKTDDTKEHIQTATSGTYKGIQWVAADLDGFNAGVWSGMCDINASSGSTISTPGSNITPNIISNLGGLLSNAILYFPYGFDYNISSGSGTSITLDAPLSAGDTIYEHYKLAWTSYAIVIESGDLYLYYNFSPTPAASLNTNKSLLLKNVGSFKLHYSEGGTLRFKLCKPEDIGNDFNVTSCKERSVF